MVIVVLCVLFVGPVLVLSKEGVGYMFGGMVVREKFYVSPLTHVLENPRDRFFQQDNLSFENMSVRMSSRTGITASLKEVPESSQKVYRLTAYFSASLFMFVELVPPQAFRLATWAKSIVLSARGDPVQVTVYLRTAHGKRRHSVTLQGSTWESFCFNLENLPEKEQYIVEKIRISAPDSHVPATISLLLTELKVYNYPQSQNSLSEAYCVFANFENASVSWRYSLNNENIPDVARIETHTTELIWRDNAHYLSVRLEAQSHQYRPLFVYFPDKLYRVPHDHDISLLIEGFAGAEQVSFIFQDARSRVFELELGAVTFYSWKRLRAQLPREVEFLKGPGQNARFVYLLGLKITPSHGALQLNLDQLESQRAWPDPFNKK